MFYPNDLFSIRWLQNPLRDGTHCRKGTQVCDPLGNKGPWGYDSVSKTWEIYLTTGHLFDSEGHLFEMEGHLFDREGHIYLTGSDICFEQGHNYVTNYKGDEILIMCTNPKRRSWRVDLQITRPTNYVTNYYGDEILIMCTNPKRRSRRVDLRITRPTNYERDSMGFEKCVTERPDQRRWNCSLMGRWHGLKTDPFSAPILCYLLHTGPKLELKKGAFLAPCKCGLIV